jgi:MFS transporter, putative metabolite:H+ symporter
MIDAGENHCAVVISGSAALIVLLCLDVGFLGPRSTGLELEQVQKR